MYVLSARIDVSTLYMVERHACDRSVVFFFFGFLFLLFLVEGS